MLADERMGWEIKESEVVAGMVNDEGGRSSGWEWPLDKITSRHSGKGNAAFADGHVETVWPKFGEQPEHYDPLY